VIPLALAACRQSAPDDLIQQEPTTQALVFVKTTGGETLNRSWSSGNLYKLSPIAPDGVVTPLTSFTGATVSDPAVSFDGKKILFSMRPSGGSNHNIYEIDADGTATYSVGSATSDGQRFRVADEPVTAWSEPWTRRAWRWPRTTPGPPSRAANRSS